MRMTRVRTALGLVLATTLALSACGSDKKPAATGTTAEGTDTTKSGPKEEIVLVQNAWTASAIEVEIAKQLIEKQLGNKVKITTIDENKMFAGLASGKLDATLELWPSGIDESEQKYLDDKSVVDMGELGAIGQIGWFVPDYVLHKFPAVKTWEGLKDAATAKAFATAATGDKGRFLGTDPSYSQDDEKIIKNLSLPFEATFSGSEPATIAELDRAVSAKEPVLMYWWTPTAAVAKYNLKQVELPEATDECRKDPEKVDCAYPADPLIKVASAKLEAKDAAVFKFVQKFQLTNDQQLELLPLVEIDKKDAKDVAAKWIADNESVWKAWFE